MRVGVDAARHHQSSGRFDDPGTRAWTKAAADLGDGLANDSEIGVPYPVGVDDAATANQELGGLSRGLRVGRTRAQSEAHGAGEQGLDDLAAIRRRGWSIHGRSRS